MDWLRLNRLNRLAAVVWALAVAAVAITDPAVLPEFPTDRVRYAVLAGGWFGGLFALTLWQRALWTATGRGVGLSPARTSGLSPRLPELRGTTRNRTVTVESYRPGHSPLSHTRIWVSLAVEDPDATLELGVTNDPDSDGRTLVRSDETGRAVVLESGSGNVREVLTPDVQAQLSDLHVPGRIHVRNRRVSYEVPYVLVGADSLRKCVEATVAIAETVERASKETERY